MPKPVVSERRFAPVELRAEESGLVTGLAAPYGSWAAIGNDFLEQFTRDSFSRSVADNAKSIPLMAMHDYDAFPVGRSESWEHTDSGLVGTWQIDVKSDEGVDVLRRIRDGFVTGLSVGFQPDREADERSVGDDGITRVVRRNARLLEVSAVSVPAYAEAQIMAVRTAGAPRALTTTEIERRKHADRRERYAQWLSDAAKVPTNS